MLSNLHLGAGVEDTFGADLGKVKYLVADQNTNQVTHFVLEKGDRQLVVRASQIQGMDDDGRTVQVDLSQEELEQLPEFAEREYVGTDMPNRSSADMAIGGGYDGSGYVYPMSGGTQVEASWVGVGGPSVSPLSGGLSGAVQADKLDQAYNERLNVPENSLIIKEGAEVEALDGKVGRVKGVNFDDAGRIVSFTVEKGLFFTEDFVVPVEVVDSANEDRIFLNETKNAINKAPRASTGTDESDYARQ